jgi:MYXO-CTERM domain-containing protein
MRKTLAVAAMTVALTTGTTAGVAFADDAVAAPPVTQTTQENADDQKSDKTGLWGLLGLLGLAGLAKRKESNDVDAQARR